MYSVSDEVLVSQLKSKNLKAFTHLYDSFAPVILGSIKRMVKCPSSAEDVLQNVFLKIWAHAERYQPTKGRLFTWIVNISRNTTIDYLRHQHNRPHEYGTAEIVETSKRRCCTERLMTRMDIRKLLHLLPSKDRGLMELIMGGFTCKEIGSLMHLTEFNVKSRLRAAYKKCRIACN